MWHSYQESNKVTIVFYICITKLNEEPTIAWKKNKPCSLYDNMYNCGNSLPICKLKLTKFCNSEKAGFINFGKLVWGMKSPKLISSRVRILFGRGDMKGAYITYNNSLRLVKCWRHSARAWAPVLPILLSIRLHVNSNNYIIIIVPDLGNYVAWSLTICTCADCLMMGISDNIKLIFMYACSIY